MTEEDRTKQLPLYKIIFIGSNGAGKSSILLRLLEKGFHDLPGTIGCDIETIYIEVKSSVVQVQLWDTGGQERFMAMISTYARDADGAFAVFDLTDRKSFEDTKRWLDELHQCEPECQVVLVGNKTDIVTIDNSSRMVTTNEAVDLSQNSKFDDRVVGYIETSAADDTNIAIAMRMLMAAILHVDADVINVKLSPKVASEQCTGPADSNRKGLSQHFTSPLFRGPYDSGSNGASGRQRTNSKCETGTTSKVDNSGNCLPNEPLSRVSFRPSRRQSRCSTRVTTVQLKPPQKQVKPACFALCGIVELYGGERKMIGELRVGDIVRTLDGWSPVMAFLDVIDRTESVEFVSIALSGGTKVELTPRHMVFIDKPECPAVFAKHIHPGTRVAVVRYGTQETCLFDNVTSVRPVRHGGAVAPLTYDGTIVVDGVGCSCYAEVENHDAAHAAMAPLRWLFELRSVMGVTLSAGEGHKGEHWYARMLRAIVPKTSECETSNEQ